MLVPFQRSMLQLVPLQGNSLPLPCPLPSKNLFFHSHPLSSIFCVPFLFFGGGLELLDQEKPWKTPLKTNQDSQIMRSKKRNLLWQKGWTFQVSCVPFWGSQQIKTMVCFLYLANSPQKLEVIKNIRRHFQEKKPNSSPITPPNDHEIKV